MAIPELKEWKEKIVEVMTILDREKLFEMATGHVSIRVPGTDLVLIPGHLHHQKKTFDDLSTEDIVLMDMDGKLVEGNTDPPGERFLHTMIYKRRPDVQSILHNHPRLGVAFSIAGVEILPVGFRGSIFYPKVPVCDYAGQIDSAETGDIVAKALGSGRSVLLQGHGAVTVGANAEEVCVAAIALEDTAEKQLLASLIGTPRPLGPEQLDGQFVKGIKPRGYFFAAWTYYSRPRKKS